jgi:hypothetical protein
VSKRHFLLAVWGLLAVYLALETVYILRLPLVMDEFQGASAVHRLSEEVPYRDFRPYKTVLGYYLQLPVLLAAPGVWSGLLWVKGQMALAVALTLAWAAFRLARTFRREAVVAALALLVPMSTFLERSAELRVDMLTGLAGLVSLVLLLERICPRNALWGGAWAALAFLVSQKGAFYAVAGGAALATVWLMRRDRHTFRTAVAFGLAGIVVGALYFGTWALIAAGGDQGGAVEATLGPAQIVLGAPYTIRLQYWTQTVVRNPLFYGLALVALVALARRSRLGGEEGERRLFLAVYGAALLALCLWFEQPWPYFFVLLIPTLTVLHLAWFDARLDARLREGGLTQTWFRLRPAAALGLALFLGVAYPLLLRTPRVLARDNAFQRYNVELAAALVGPEETYLAGVDLLWDRPQASPALAWIDASVFERLHALGGAQQDALIRELESRPIKLLVESYRTRRLPGNLQAYLNSRFRQVVGNLHLYSPITLPMQERLRLKFSGEYLVELRGEGGCLLNDQPLSHGQRLPLKAGEYANGCTVPVRLTLLPPELEARFDPRFQESRPLFPNVYGY